MGTPWRLVVYASDSLSAQTAFKRVRARVEAVEQASSDYRSDSEINRLAALSAGRDHGVSADLFELLQRSLQLARHSRGAFDPTVGPLTKLWRRAIRQQTFPDKRSIRRARTQVHYRWVTIREPDFVRLRKEGMQLDFGGIAKGYALDAAGAVLREQGIFSYLIDGGGDLLLGAPPPGRPGWTVHTPRGHRDLYQTAVAVSGSTYRYLDHAGRRYSHIVDPRTGLGVNHLGTVMVTGPEAALADGLASAISVLGQRDGHKLLRHYPGYTLWWKEALPSSP